MPREPHEPRVSPAAPERAGQPHRRRPPIIPVTIFLGFAVFIAYQEVPAVRDAIEKILRPEQWRATQTCQQAALADAREPAYARVIDAGEVHATQAGFYVEAVRVGEMSEDGREQNYQYSCYLDPAGALIKSHRDGAR